jgi:hypothetical protein
VSSDVTSFLTWQQQAFLSKQVRAVRAQWAAVDGWPLFVAALICHRRATAGLEPALVSAYVSGDEEGLTEAMGFSVLPWIGTDTSRRALVQRCVEVLWREELEQVWTDPLAVGWVFQFYNDPERRQLDEKVAKRGKIQPDEVASKTQLFTERYLCDWLLENSLGALWRGICTANGWSVEPAAYWVERPRSERLAIQSVRDLRVLDPAVGTGNFLVIAFEMLMDLYGREAAFRGEEWSAASSAQRIVEHNLFGLDIDADAVCLAKVVLWWRVRAFGAEPRWMNLGAPDGGGHGEALREWAMRWGVSRAARERLEQRLEALPALGSLSPLGRYAAEAVASAPDPAGALSALDRALSAAQRREVLPLSAQPSPTQLMLRSLKEQEFHGVVGNPPYLGVKKMGAPKPIEALYPNAKADLFAVFIERAENLSCVGGLVAMITLHNWMFLSSFGAFRADRARRSALEVCAHIGLGGGFSGWSDNNVVMQTAMFVYRRGGDWGYPTRWLRLNRFANAEKAEALRRQSGLVTRAVASLAAIPDRPLIYWWSEAELERYVESPKMADETPVRQGLATSNNRRFVRFPWEVPKERILQRRTQEPRFEGWGVDWVPFIKGAAGKTWFEPLSDIIAWRQHGLELKLHAQKLYGSYTRTIKNEAYYFCGGVSYSTIGAEFRARARRWQSVFDVSGSAVFPQDIANVVCLLNSDRAKGVLEALNPTANFQVGDVNRLPLVPVANAAVILGTLEEAFTAHERGRETSVGFVSPGPSAWGAAQAWARRMVNLTEGAALEPFIPEYEEPSALDRLSYAFGLAVGRFGEGSGWAPRPPSAALADGVLFVGPGGVEDSLSLAACAPLHAAWRAVGEEDLRAWLRLRFFKQDHLGRYRKRPIYWPLSSKHRSFVVWVSAHRFRAGLLEAIVERWLVPARGALSAASDQVELSDFISELRRLSRCGPLRARAGDPQRELDLPLELAGEDGFRVQSAALWSLLEPQWKEPRRWWSELCRGEGRADCDWSRLAARYFPKRVTEKCAVDASIAVAHGRLWRDHPRAAYEWELRFSQEFGRTIRLDEAGAEVARARFEGGYPEIAAAIRGAPKRRGPVGQWPGED